MSKGFSLHQRSDLYPNDLAFATFLEHMNRENAILEISCIVDLIGLKPNGIIIKHVLHSTIFLNK
jgi:hypothetical protein